MELFKDRLLHILRAKNLTATQFAEMLQIQPSNISHLLAGRNKPSFDFIIKLKSLYPEYNLDWIIMGKKPITVSEPISLQNNNLFDKTDEVELEYKLTDNTSNADINEIPIPRNEIDVLNNNSIPKQIIYVYDDHTFEIYNVRR